MEKYTDFINRISYQQPALMINDEFTPSKSVFDKVNPENTLKPFFGDTVVFKLGFSAKAKTDRIIDRLFKTVPECFCERLNADTLHMTLHDLCASPVKQEADKNSLVNEKQLKTLLKNNPLNPEIIRMKTNYIVNMIDISLVLALIPADENEWNKLSALYSLIDNVKKCDYPFLTPHITLAYYNYKGFKKSSAEKLRALSGELNKSGFEFELNTENLFYERFTDMNNYVDVFPLV